MPAIYVEVQITRQQFRAAVHKVLTHNNFSTFPKQAQAAITKLFEQTDLELFGADQDADEDNGPALPSHPEEKPSPQESSTPREVKPGEEVTVDHLVETFLQILTMNWPKVSEGHMFPESQLQPLADALGGMLNSILQGVDLGGGGAGTDAPDREGVIRGPRPDPNFKLPPKEARPYAS